MVLIPMTVYFKDGTSESMKVSNGSILLKYIMPLITSEKVKGVYVHGIYSDIKKEESE